MTTDPLAPALAAAPVIAILRSQSPRHFAATADALHEAGIRAMEFTLTTPGVLHALREYAESKPAGTALGAGTVMTPADAMRAVAAGATYLITPAVCPDVIREGRRLGVPVLPGALTPSEMVAAWREGATMVKLFPASAGGPEYLRAVRAPLPHVPLVPTGGIELDRAPAYFAAGATALGMGSPLIGDACEGGDLDALRERAAALLDGIRS
ncbi:bifunctional 4-hydroxy-2-oxoglutarate aldolase/2-dehydro-3-deoxy-phosphogluconate aldolase [Streptomyces sp. NPDC088748]|uniref:bifunctional 4-hydroxy-2-oxoglutarate aldolase/2-dehydro-3-deoxy-phosphogluconate aldolase n=1 Tax=Streptomyces sp. NPDC088748 TaxID=3365887 RepID=UPI00380BBBAF